MEHRLCGTHFEHALPIRALIGAAGVDERSKCSFRCEIYKREWTQRFQGHRLTLSDAWLLEQMATRESWANKGFVDSCSQLLCDERMAAVLLVHHPTRHGETTFCWLGDLAQILTAFFLGRVYRDYRCPPVVEPKAHRSALTPQRNIHRSSIPEIAQVRDDMNVTRRNTSPQMGCLSSRKA